MAGDLSKFSLVLSKSKAFSRFLVYSGYIWRFSGKRKYRACTVLYLKFEHQFHFSFIELNGNCGLLSSRYIWSIGESLQKQACVVNLSFILLISRGCDQPASHRVLTAGRQESSSVVLLLFVLFFCLAQLMCVNI